MSNVSKGFMAAEPGQRVRSGGRNYRITHLITVDTVFAVDEETQESTRLRVDSLSPAVDEDKSSPAATTTRELSQYTEKEWQGAQRRFQAIKPLLDNPIRTRTDAEKIAKDAGVHVATIYKWLKAYLEAGHVSALVQSKRGPAEGSLTLDREQEKLINDVINEEFLTKQRKKAVDVVEEVQRRARLAKLPAPHPNTIRNRIRMLPVAETLRKRGQQEKARNDYEPIRGQFPDGDFPLAVVEIDHTPADIILVDEVNRQPIGRPWITLAIDVCSRNVVGLYVSFERPNAAAVGLCISHAICPKREYLARLGVSAEWPVWGAMNVIYVDNAKEFRGVALERGCEEYKISLQWRPAKRPHFGGHIERLMGTAANQIRKWPGATFSNITQRKGYDSEAESALTITEFEVLLVEFITNVYHQRNHSKLGMSPKKKWDLGILGDAESPGIGIPPVPADSFRLSLDFMPFFERSVQQYGIQIDNITYYDPVLDPYINAVDPNNPKLARKFTVRRDPRNISKIYFFDPVARAYFPIPYANVGRSPLSLWELNEIKSRLKAEGKKDINENLIFETLGRMRALVESAVQKTKAARRQATRTPAAAKTAAVPKSELAPLPFVPVPSLEDDPFAVPIQPFSDVSLSR